MTIWHQRWTANQIGFHREVVNDVLEKYWASIEPNPKGSVLVPLCGKSIDMHWLVEQGHEVIGVELVQKAVDAFFNDANVTPSIEHLDGFTRYTSGKNTILQGDVFALSPSLATCQAWYDRAALVALPSSIRPAYVEQIHALCDPGSVGLMITFAYPQEQMQGPPFSLPNEEVEDLFGDSFIVELLEQIPLEDEKDRGLTNVHSSVYKITKI